MPDQPPSGPPGPDEPGRHHVPEGRRTPPGYQFIDDLNASARRRSTRRGRAAAALGSRGVLIALVLLLLAGAGVGTGLALTGGGGKSTAGDGGPGRPVFTSASSRTPTAGPPTRPGSGSTSAPPAHTNHNSHANGSSPGGNPSGEHPSGQSHPPRHSHASGSSHSPGDRRSSGAGRRPSGSGAGSGPHGNSSASSGPSGHSSPSGHSGHSGTSRPGHSASSSPGASSPGASSSAGSAANGSSGTDGTSGGGTSGQATGTAEAPAPPPPDQAQPAVERIPAIPVNVLNNTTVSHLAARAAGEFRDGGWTIGTVGNFTGRIPETTVYYDRGDTAQQNAAEQLQRQFPGILRVLPHYDGLPISGLTVVLAPDWD